MNRNKLEKERVYLTHSLQSVIKESQARTQAEITGKHHSLACSAAFLRHPKPSDLETIHPQWAVPSYIS